MGLLTSAQTTWPLAKRHPCCRLATKVMMYKARGTECGQAFLQKSWVIYAKRFTGNGSRMLRDMGIGLREMVMTVMMLEA